MVEDFVARELRTQADNALRTIIKAKVAMRIAQRLSSAGAVRSVRQFLRSERRVVVSVAALDSDPMLLNTPDGIVDLRDGMLQPSDPSRLCTKTTAVGPALDKQCPEWMRFLSEATGGDVELAAYLQRLCGYALTGDTREQQFAFVYGPGGNGKSVFLNVLTGILGDYAKVATADTFMASTFDRHSTELAMLAGCRLVTASETPAGKRWDEVRVKGVTGGEPITARFMRQDNFTYVPQFKLIVAGNHRPTLENVTPAMKRRMHVVPFTVTPAQVDLQLGEKLKAEWPAILAWMIEGCLAWQQHGLCVPDRVAAATADYFDGQDTVGTWLQECCETEGRSVNELQTLVESFNRYSSTNNGRTLRAQELSEALTARGFTKSKHPTTRRAMIHGIGVVTAGDLAIVK
jgi:putative DNA primase/helicase